LSESPEDRGPKVFYEVTLYAELKEVAGNTITGNCPVVADHLYLLAAFSIQSSPWPNRKTFSGFPIGSENPCKIKGLNIRPLIFIFCKNP
jgi:hypothetical protein